MRLSSPLPTTGPTAIARTREGDDEVREARERRRRRAKAAKRERHERPASPKTTGLLRYTADVRTLAFVTIYFGLVAFQWTADVPWTSSPLHIAAAAALLAVTCVFSFLGAVATHNAVHAPIFRSRGLNRVAQVVLTLTYGHPVSAFVPGHTLSHHKHTQTRRDVMRTTKARFDLHLFNLMFFMAKVGGDVFRADFRYALAMRKRNPPWFRQFVLEWAVFLGASAALLLLDWKKFIAYVLVPHQFAAWGIITMNLLQHDGCDAKSEYNHSRNFVGKFVNWWTYNNGYHTIHHMEPGLHWSLAPVEHAKRVAPHIHPALDQQNLLVYLWRTFGWPGKRTTYDGKPLVLPKEGPDQEWIPAPSQTRGDLGAIG